MSRRVVASGSASGCSSAIAPVELDRKADEDYVTLLKSSRSFSERPDLKEIPVTFKYESFFDVSGTNSVYSKSIFPATDSIFADFATLYDEVKFESVEVTLDSRDFLKVMDTATPSTSGAMSSCIFGHSNLYTVDPATTPALWDRSNAHVLQWSFAKPCVTFSWKTPSITNISTGVLLASSPGGWFNMAQVAAQSSSTYQLTRMYMGLSSQPYMSTTHGYVNYWITIHARLRQRKGSA